MVIYVGGFQHKEYNINNLWLIMNFLILKSHAETQGMLFLTKNHPGGDEWQWRHNDVIDDDIEMINKYEFCDHKKYETVIFKYSFWWKVNFFVT